MSGNDVTQNDNLVLISGSSATGKSASLRNIQNPEGVVYCNFEGKKLPFKSGFREFIMTDPYQLYDAFTEVEDVPDVHTVVVDSITFMMDMFESIYVTPAANGLKAWGDYANFFKTLMNQYVAKSTKNVIMLAHTKQILNESEMVMEVKVGVKGSLNTQGVESYFSTVISSKKMDIKKIRDFDSKLLNITEEEEMLGFKYLYQTRLTRETVNERIRSPMSMWDVNETYIDNDINLVIKRLHEYYH